MPLRRHLSTFVQTLPFNEDAVMTDANVSGASTLVSFSSPPLIPSGSVNGSPTMLGKRCYEEVSEQEPDSQPTAGPSSTPSDANAHGGTSPPPASSGRPTTPPLKRPNLSLSPIVTTSTDIYDPFSPSHVEPELEPASPVPTEIATDLPDVELTHEERIQALQAAGIKARDFAHEPFPNSHKAPEVFDPVPSLIAADWHMRNPNKNYGLLTPKALFRLVKIGWLSLAEVGRHFNPIEFSALAKYNDRPDEQRYPFVVVPSNEPMPTPSQRVRMRRKAGLAIHWDDHHDSAFFGYNPSGLSDDEDEPSLTHPRPTPLPVEGDSAPEGTSGAGVGSGAGAEKEAGEPKAKRRKVKSTAKPRGRAKPLRRECSRPEV